jgi:hypothetical protein
MKLPILTLISKIFDFEDFRAAPPEAGYWQLVVDESGYVEATG